MSLRISLREGGMDKFEEMEKRHQRKLAERAAAEKAKLEAQPKLKLINLGVMTTTKIVVPKK